MQVSSNMTKVMYSTDERHCRGFSKFTLKDGICDIIIRKIYFTSLIV